MQTVDVLRDDIIMTQKGPLRIFAGEAYVLEDEIAASLVGRGFAKYVVVTQIEVKDKKVKQPAPPPDLGVKAEEKAEVGDKVEPPKRKSPASKK